MNKVGSICTIMLLLLLASACSGAATPSGPSVGDIYTSVAITLTAQAGAITPTKTAQLVPSPTATETGLLTPSPTPEASEIKIAASPTQENVNVVSSSSSSECNNSMYVSDVTIPDGTVLAPGQSFVKTWKFQNTGTCKWSSSYQITFVKGKKMDGSDSEIDQTVSSGSNAKISVSMIAPDSEGTYTGYWQLADTDGTVFGASVYVQIEVSEDADTLTPTLTSTEDTSTPTETETSEDDDSTATATRTSTRTRTPTHTPTPKPTSTTRPTQTSTSTPAPAATEAPSITLTPTPGS